MQVCVVGINHKTTPVAIRSRAVIGSSRLHEALLFLSNSISPGIILGTCNRTEVYILAKEESTASAIIDFLCHRDNLPPAELLPYVYIHHGESAIEHLFRVASGLDSMIIGEYEILGQVKNALLEAERTVSLELPLIHLFRHAVRTGRKVRTETGISRNALSVSSAAVDLAIQVVGDIRHCRLVVVGAGEAGRLAAKACRERGNSQIVVVSRSQKKAKALVASLNASWSPMDRLGQELATCDIAITCSGAPHTILKLGLIKEVMKVRSQEPLVIIDIAVPPNVDSEVKQLDNVFVYNIDEITKVCETNNQQRHDEIHSALEIVNQEVERFATHWWELQARPVISALVKKAEDVRQSGFDMTLKKLPGLSGDERAHLDAMTRSIVRKILHEPIQYLKNGHNSQGKYIQVVKELFNLDEQN